MGKQYYLTNGICRFQVRDGKICSAKALKDVQSTEYINNDRGFGELTLVYLSEGKLNTWSPLCDEGLADEGVVGRGRELSCSWQVRNACLSVSIAFALKADTLHQTITVSNVTDHPVELKDLGITLCCQTDFRWGRDASKEVIGHHFIAGHGSHSTIYRCDGSGPILAAMPVNGSRWIYYDSPKDTGKQVQEKDTVILYALNGHIGRKVEEKGAKLRIPYQSHILEGGESYELCMDVFFAADYEACKRQFTARGQVQAESIPGYTVPRDLEVFLCLTSMQTLRVTSQSPDVGIELQREEGERRFYRLTFAGLGERDIRVDYGECCTHLYYFVTEPIQTLLEKRAAFLTRHQIKDENKWYRGLFPEWNNETGVKLSPDNYDKIRGWRIYEVTCDDPGLSKPAFLSTKQTVAPVQEQIDALDDYITYFVWGGLQQTEDEPYPYAIYGIPDWYTLRHSDKPGNTGRTHLWRIYDYPHIALLYFNMYETVRLHPGMKTRLPVRTYLYRAYRTALAMFQVPEELDGWSAYKTGLYNELIIPEIVEALRREEYITESDRLGRYWKRKAAWFVKECRDLFGSEYPFDTTGFESTQALAAEAIKNASYRRDDSQFSTEVPYEKAILFMENQIACNISCRGMLEPAYFWYGSDYRGNNMHYTLSYMSQMGGWALLDYACYYAREPFEVLRLAYGSILSSWALLNSGDAESGYGWWFPGSEHDGSACGGFEPLYGHTTWLEQPCMGGAWYYSCEIDLGFCGGIRGASMVLAEDPLFGIIAYGAVLDQTDCGWQLEDRDGAGRRFHFIGKQGKIHVELEGFRFADQKSVFLTAGLRQLELNLIRTSETGTVKILTEELGDFQIRDKGSIIRDQEPFVWQPIGEQICLNRLCADS